MAINIGTINTTQTFENWLTKTNDLVNALATNVITAAPGGQTTNGDATLVGDFTSTNLTAST